MKKRSRIFKIITRSLLFAVSSISLAVVMYGAFALAVSNATERRLTAENRQFAKVLPTLEEKAALISDELQSLRSRDNDIYMSIYDTPVPELVWKVGTVDNPDDIVARVDRAFEEIYSVVEGSEARLPMLLPIEGLTPAQAGASTGKKMSSIFKVAMEHSGIDLVAPQGTPVVASADGVVSDVSHGTKGHGNIVEITHDDGFVTRYCQLEDIFVHKGAPVRAGAKIGTVGISSATQAAHLHYEVLRSGIPQNPVHYFFSSLTPEQYTTMLYISSKTTQSLD